MDIVLLILLSISIVLFILSFFMNDPVKAVKEELDQLSIQWLQDTYQLKKRVRVLEEELLIPETTIPEPVGKKIDDSLKKQVHDLYLQGVPLEEITKQTALTKNEALAIIQEQK